MFGMKFATPQSTIRDRIADMKERRRKLAALEAEEKRLSEIAARTSNKFEGG